MEKGKFFALGVDFGSLSARAVIADCSDGEEVGSAVSDYAHGVMSESLPTGEKLPADWALQHPRDYVESFYECVRGAIAAAGIDPRSIVGVGTDFTASTLLPVDENAVPLCFNEEFEREKHAYVKMWKHHSPSPYADRINEVAARRGEKFLARYGGKVSSELAMPKVLETLCECERVYDRAYAFIEAGDWIVGLLTGGWVRSESFAGFKSQYMPSEGYPSPDFLAELHPKMRGYVSEKMHGRLLGVGSVAGGLDAAVAAELGMKAGVPVAVANIDSHAGIPAAGRPRAGEMLAVLGTSAVYLALLGEMREIGGVCGTLENGAVPGLCACESGQSGLGDILGWFVDNAVPASVAAEAEKRGMSVHALLTERASALRAGESGLVALDWWNGNRCILADFSLSGLIAGLTLATAPHEIYRALIEAMAFGARVIVENYERQGVPIDAICATGGIARKNTLFMQIYADVVGKEIRIVRSDTGSALGSAIFGAGVSVYDGVAEAAEHMGGLGDKVYRPDSASKAVYDKLYVLYRRLHDRFSSGDDLMRSLRAISASVRA